MARRTFLRPAVVIFGLLSMTGCETLFHRKATDEKKVDPKDEVATDDIQDLKHDGGTKAFHKNNRLSGGLSDQAREIESHFNIQ